MKNLKTIGIGILTASLLTTSPVLSIERNSYEGDLCRNGGHTYYGVTVKDMECLKLLYDNNQATTSKPNKRCDLYDSQDRKIGVGMVVYTNTGAGGHWWGVCAGDTFFKLYPQFRSFFKHQQKLEGNRRYYDHRLYDNDRA